MKKYNVLIIDDEIENINLLKLYLNKYSKVIDKVNEATTIDEAVQNYISHYPDILLLDIALGNNETCFKILEALPYINAEIIFTTSHKDYAIQAINNAKTAAYLLKPIKPSELVVAIDKTINNIEKEKSKTAIIAKNTSEPSSFIAIPSSNKIDILHPEDIVYIEADGRYTVFHLTNGNHKIASKNIGEFEKLLDHNTFFRIHHSYIVNLNMVENINKSAGNYCELFNNKMLPIAKRRQDQLHRFLKIK